MNKGISLCKSFYINCNISLNETQVLLLFLHLVNSGVTIPEVLWLLQTGMIDSL